MRVYVVVFLFLGIIVLCLAGPIALITHSLLFDATGRPPWLESALRERSPEETAAELKSSLEWLSGLGWTVLVLFIGFICVAVWWFMVALRAVTSTWAATESPTRSSPFVTRAEWQINFPASAFVVVTWAPPRTPSRYPVSPICPPDSA